MVYRLQSLSEGGKAETQGRNQEQNVEQRAWRNAVYWLAQLLFIYEPGLLA